MDQQLLNQAKANGCSDRLAVMLASRRPPGAVTDTLAFAGIGTEDPFASVPPPLKPKYRRMAKEAGVNPAGKRYMSSLAAFPGDPEALIDSRGDAKRVLEKRGWGAEGMVKTKAREATTPEPDGKPAEDIVEDRAMNMLAKDGCDGTCTVREWSDAKEKAVASLTPPEIT